MPVTEGPPTERVGPSHVPAGKPADRPVWLAAAAAVLLLAAILRMAALDHPPRSYFDEVYYAEDAAAVARQGVEERRPSHPPLGPLLISLGVLAAGDGPWGWRLTPALAGTGVVLFTGLAARRLGAGRSGAVGAMLLVALDGLSLTMSRIAMLDVLVAVLVVAGFWVLSGTNDRVPGQPGWMARMVLAGALFGFATAVKWSGALALAAAVIVATWRTASWLRRYRPSASSVVGAVGMVVVALVVVPAMAYIASYAGWFVNYEETAVAEERCPEGGCDMDLSDRMVAWWEEQVRLVDYHRRLPATHPYRSSPQSWPLLLRPVLYYYEDCPVGLRIPPGECQVDPGREAKILGLGNPALWWAAVPMSLVMAWNALVRRRAWAVILTVFIVAQYVPWFFAGKDGYLFYLTPVVPFLAVGLVLSLRSLGRWSGWGIGLVAGLAIAAFVYFAPIWYGIPLPEGAADARMWLESWR